MEILFKNKDKRALLEELVDVCRSMAKEGLIREVQNVAYGTKAIYLSYRADQSNNRIDFDLIKPNGEPLQPFSIQVFEREGIAWVHLYFVDSNSKHVKEDVPLSEVEQSLYKLVLGIRTASRVSAFLHALRGVLCGYVYLRGC